MSKNHFSQSQADIDAELDEYLKGKATTPIVKSSGEGIDLFGSDMPEKKKGLLQRVKEFLLSLLYQMA